MPETETTLRDRLAVKRTELANERTLLAYARTALMLVASGATLWRLQPLGAGDRGLGVAAILIGILVLAIGLWRFLRTSGQLEQES